MRHSVAEINTSLFSNVDACKILSRNAEGNRPFESPRQWENNIEIHLQLIGCKYVD
jgi:hypothetical protein